MSQDELDALAQQELELKSQMEALNAKRLEIEKRKLEIRAAEKANMVITVTAQSVQGGAVICAVSPEMREDVLTILRNTKGRWYNSVSRTNTIPLDEWEGLAKKILALPNVGLVYGNGTALEIERILRQPRFSVTITDDMRSLGVVLGFKVSNHIIGGIPGAKFNDKMQGYLVPVSEGFRLWEALVKEDSVVWTDEAKELVLSDVARRTELDSIALAQDAPDIQVDFTDTSVALRPFQRVGVKFAQAAGFKIILADQMGLGKTIQAIAMFMLLRREIPNARMAVVCPANLKINWLRELERLTGITPGVFSGSEPGVRDLQRLVIEKSDPICIFNYDILARTKETFKDVTDGEGNKLRQNVIERRLWVDLINASGFDFMAIDEAHYIKNTGSYRSIAVRELTCPRLAFMTGTPVLNRPGELWPMLTMIRPDQFPSEDNFLSRYTWNGKEARNVEELRQLLKPIMIRRLKKDVMKDLPALERIYDWHEMSPKALMLYNKVLMGVYLALAEWNPGEAGAEKAVPNILAQIMRLKQVCAIDKMDRVAELATELYGTHENGGASKVIIFSQFKPIAKGLAARLGQGAVCMTGDDNEYERQRIVDRFQTDKSIHFLTGTWQVMGEGRNLTAAGYVVFSDLFWTPANHQQCEERCYGRIGDMHGATSYYVVVKDTIEDWIQEILARKLKVINDVVEGIDTERSASVANELMMRMKSEMYKQRRG